MSQEQYQSRNPGAITDPKKAEYVAYVTKGTVEKSISERDRAARLAAIDMESMPEFPVPGISKRKIIEYELGRTISNVHQLTRQAKDLAEKASHDWDNGTGGSGERVEDPNMALEMAHASKEYQEGVNNARRRVARDLAYAADKSIGLRPGVIASEQSEVRRARDATDEAASDAKKGYIAQKQ